MAEPEVCRACRWAQTDAQHDLTCRRRAPIHAHAATVWPVVRPLDWCGEFEHWAPAPKGADHARDQSQG